MEERIKKGVELQVVHGAHARGGDMHDNGSSHEGYTGGVYVDDTNGNVLDPKATKDARQLEMRTLSDMHVYDCVLRGDAVQDSFWEIVGVRWVDVQEGPIVRSQLVAQEFAKKKTREMIPSPRLHRFLQQRW